MSARHHAATHEAESVNYTKTLLTPTPRHAAQYLQGGRTEWSIEMHRIDHQDGAFRPAHRHSIRLMNRNALIHRLRRPPSRSPLGSHRRLS
ncbi:MAG: hypothetical protein QOF52_2794 [Propionibacteriaceae bacterium]|jgi:hypothetical protein|nr:hypothetical protein [Propionibacteriaceae bacterium]